MTEDEFNKRRSQLGQRLQNLLDNARIHAATLKELRSLATQVESTGYVVSPEIKTAITEGDTLQRRVEEHVAQKADAREMNKKSLLDQLAVMSTKPEGKAYWTKVMDRFSDKKTGRVNGDRWAETVLAGRFPEP